MAREMVFLLACFLVLMFAGVSKLQAAAKVGKYAYVAQDDQVVPTHSIRQLAGCKRSKRSLIRIRALGWGGS